jgi:hypothetical protein
MWEFDPYHNSIITGGNGGTKPTQAALPSSYNQGTQRYDLEQTLQPDEQIDVGKLDYGGEGGIRTHDTVPRMLAFEASTFNHSVTSPQWSAPIV